MLVVVIGLGQATTGVRSVSSDVERAPRPFRVATFSSAGSGSTILGFGL